MKISSNVLSLSNHLHSVRSCVRSRCSTRLPLGNFCVNLFCLVITQSLAVSSDDPVFTQRVQSQQWLRLPFSMPSASGEKKYNRCSPLKSQKLISLPPLPAIRFGQYSYIAYPIPQWQLLLTARPHQNNIRDAERLTGISKCATRGEKCPGQITRRRRRRSSGRSSYVAVCAGNSQAVNTSTGCDFSGWRRKGIVGLHSVRALEEGNRAEMKYSTVEHYE